MVKWLLLLLLWLPAAAELASVDETPVLGTEHWVRRLRDLPDLGPGEQVYGLLWAQRGAVGDDTRQLVVEIRQQGATFTVYRLGGQVVQQRLLSAEELANFQSGLAQLPDDYEADDSEPDAFAYVHFWDDTADEQGVAPQDPFLQVFRSLLH